MKKTLFLTAAVSLLFWTGCKEKPEPEPEPSGQPEIVLTEITGNQMTFPGEGGQATVLYTIENPVEGGTVRAVSDQEWISDMNYGDEGAVTFSVLENEETESRNAIVTITYEWTDGKVDEQINVIQTGRSVFFDIQVPEDEVTSATARVITKCLGDLRWFDGLVRSSVIAESQDFSEIVLSDFKALVAKYEEMGYSIDDILYVSDYVDDYTWMGLPRSTAFTPYAFGMDLDYNFTTDIHYGPEFTTGEIEYKDLTFELTVDPKQTSALLNIVPSDQNAWYFATVIGDSFDEAGYTDEQIMEYLCNAYGTDLETYALMGTVSGREIVGMSPGTHYTAVAFGVDLDSYMYNSAMTRTEFQTTGNEETKAYATGNLDNYWRVADLIEYNPEYADDFRVDEGNPLLAAMVVEFNETAVGAYYSSWIGDVSAMGDMLFNATVQGNFYTEKDGCVDFFYMNFTAASTLCVVAVDADGNFGDMYMEVTHRTEDGVSQDFALFDEYYGAMHASSPSAVRQFVAPERPSYTLTVSSGPETQVIPGKRTIL